MGGQCTIKSVGDYDDDDNEITSNNVPVDEVDVKAEWEGSVMSKIIEPSTTAGLRQRRYPPAESMSGFHGCKINYLGTFVRKLLSIQPSSQNCNNFRRDKNLKGCVAACQAYNDDIQ